MYRLSYDIRIGDYRVKTLKGVKITTSVLNLADTATIEFPGQYLRNWTKVEDKVKVGDAVCIRLGYDDHLETEFIGYLKRISRDNNTLVFECEDALYLLDKSVEDREYKTVTIRELLTEILHQVDAEFEVDCDFDFTYDKMVVFKSTALDVLKKVHEDTKANIWFEGKTLHVHPVYQASSGEEPVIYDTEVNIQKNELKWKDKADKKVMVEVKYVNPNGELTTENYGVDGGAKITKYVGVTEKSSLMKSAENEYNLWNYSGYEGSFTGWLVPVVKAGGCVRLRDKERPEGKYYVTGVEIEFGQSGAKRKVTLGRQIN